MGLVQPKDNQALWKLYELVLAEEYKYVEANQRRAAFFVTVFSGLLAALAFSFANIDGVLRLVLLPITGTMFVICMIAKESSRRFYQRLLEALSRRALIEADLGMTHVPEEAVSSSRPYWKAEPLVAPRHRIARNKDWINEANEYTQSIGKWPSFCRLVAFGKGHGPLAQNANTLESQREAFVIVSQQFGEQKVINCLWNWLTVVAACLFLAIVLTVLFGPSGGSDESSDKAIQSALDEVQYVGRLYP